MSNHGVSLHNSEITGYWFEDCHLDVRNRALRHGEETMAHNSKHKYGYMFIGHAIALHGEVHTPAAVRKRSSRLS